jgi:uncharacterized membrane protein
MEFTPLVLLAVVATITALGFMLACEHGKQFRRFSWEEYSVLSATVFVAIVPMLAIYGWGILTLFFVSVAVGMCAEHICGYVFHRSLKRHMWRYYRFTLGGYTSLLVAPFWGMAGVFFFLLSKIVGV